MAILDLKVFGGLVPKAHARALPADNAQTANNISAVTHEFRPLAADTTVIANTSVSGPLTLYRFPLNSDGSLNTDFSTLAKWKVYADQRSLVPSQLNDDITCRTYVTIDDGSAAPRVIDNGGGDRQMGVPTPTTAPTIVVNEVDEFTLEDRSQGLTTALELALAAVRGNVTESWIGATHPGTSTTGYVDYSTTYGFNHNEQALQLRAYRLAGTGQQVSDSYTSLDDTLFSWIFDPSIGGFPGASNGTPDWADPSSTPHWLVPFHSYGQTFTLDTGALTTALAAIEMPGMDDGTKLFTGGQVAEIVDELDAYVDPAGPGLKPKIDAIKAKVDEMKILLDGGANASMATGTEAFYAKADVAAIITAAKTKFANDVWSAAWLIAHSSTPADYLGAGS